MEPGLSPRVFENAFPQLTHVRRISESAALAMLVGSNAFQSLEHVVSLAKRIQPCDACEPEKGRGSNRIVCSTRAAGINSRERWREAQSFATGAIAADNVGRVPSISRNCAGRKARLPLAKPVVK